MAPGNSTLADPDLHVPRSACSPTSQPRGQRDGQRSLNQSFPNCLFSPPLSLYPPFHQSHSGGGSNDHLNPNEDASGTASPGFSVIFTPLAFSGFLKLSPCGFGGNDRRPCAQVLPTCQGSTEHAPRAPCLTHTSPGRYVRVSSLYR